MNTQQLRADVEANLNKLPDHFISSNFYDSVDKCFCFYGWLGNVVEGIEPFDMMMDSSVMWDFLERRYDLKHGGEVIQADQIIRAAGGHPRVVVNEILKSLEEPTNV